MRGDPVAYLEAKRSVDDRALDRDTLRRVRGVLENESGDDPPTTVLEAGAGTGALLRRALAWDLPPLEWVAVDTDADVLDAAASLVADRAARLGYAVDASGDARELRLDGPAPVTVRLRRADVRDVAAERRVDGLVGQSFADLVSVASTVSLVDAVADGGWFYLPLTFDGETSFRPSHGADDAVVAAYHDSMRGPHRPGPAAGRAVVAGLREAGYDPTVARSDWRVAPVEGAYPADEERFLRVLVDTVADEGAGRVPAATLAAWESRRRAQLDAGALRFRARNVDIFGGV